MEFAVVCVQNGRRKRVVVREQPLPMLINPIFVKELKKDEGNSSNEIVEKVLTASIPDALLWGLMSDREYELLLRLRSKQIRAEPFTDFAQMSDQEYEAYLERKSRAG